MPTPNPPTPCRALILRTGYVEENSIGCLVYVNRRAFPTVKKALESFGGALLRAIQEEKTVTFGVRECCGPAVRDSLPKEWRYCPRCRRDLSDTGEVTEDQLADRVRQLLSDTNDSMGGDTWETLDEEGWETFSNVKELHLLGENAAYVFEYGEILVARAAFGTLQNPDDVDPNYWWRSNIHVPEGMVLG